MSDLVHRQLRIPGGCAPPRPTADALAMHAAQLPARATPPPTSPRNRTPRRHRPWEHLKPPCIVVFVHRGPLGCTPIRFRVALLRRRVRRYPASCASDAGAPNRAVPVRRETIRARPLPQSPSRGIRQSPRPVHRPSADPILARPTEFASSVCCCVSVWSSRRSKCKRLFRIPEYET